MFKSKNINKNPNQLTAQATSTNQKKIPATWLIRKYALVKWEKEHRGLIFSVVKRTVFTNQLGLELFDTRVIIEPDQFNRPTKWKVVIFHIGLKFF